MTRLEVLWEYAASTRPHLDFSSSSSDSDLGDSDSSDRGYGDYYDTGVSHYSKGKSLDSKTSSESQALQLGVQAWCNQQPFDRMSVHLKRMSALLIPWVMAHLPMPHAASIV